MNILNRREGRLGEPSEYVEFQPVGSRLRFIAQLGNGGLWFVFRSEPGHRGAVRTLGQYQRKASAISAAQRFAQKEQL